MTIGNRAVSRMEMGELIKWEAVFAARYENELRRERIGREPFSNRGFGIDLLRRRGFHGPLWQCIRGLSGPETETRRPSRRRVSDA